MLLLLLLAPLALASPTSRNPRFYYGSLPFGQHLSGTFDITSTTRACGRTPPTAVSTDGTGTLAACTVQGKVEFRQSFLTGHNADYTVWLHGAGIQGATGYYVGFSTDCTLTGSTEFTDAQTLYMGYQQLNEKVTSPMFMINGFYIKGRSSVFNIDGTGGRFGIAKENLFFVVTDAAGTFIGCTKAKLASCGGHTCA